MTNNSFILYTEYQELINQLTNEQCGHLFKCVFEYNLTGKISETMDAVTKMLFTVIRQDLDRNAVKYEEKCKKMSENGKKGGRPRKSEIENKIENQKFFDEEKECVEKEEEKYVEKNEEKNQKNQKVFSKSKKSLYENENDNVNENVNVSLFSLSNQREEYEERDLRDESISSRDDCDLSVEVDNDESISSMDDCELNENIDRDLRDETLTLRDDCAQNRKTDRDLRDETLTLRDDCALNRNIDREKRDETISLRDDCVQNRKTDRDLRDETLTLRDDCAQNRKTDRDKRDETISLRDDCAQNRKTDRDKRDETLRQEDREILEDYIRRKKLAKKSVRAYASKLIANGDYMQIVEREKARLEKERQERLNPARARADTIQNELSTIVDKASCLRVLARYYNALEEIPEEFDEVRKKYDLDTSCKLEEYAYNCRSG